MIRTFSAKVRRFALSELIGPPHLGTIRVVDRTVNVCKLLNRGPLSRRNVLTRGRFRVSIDHAENTHRTKHRAPHGGSQRVSRRCRMVVSPSARRSFERRMSRRNRTKHDMGRVRMRGDYRS